MLEVRCTLAPLWYTRGGYVGVVQMIMRDNFSFGILALWLRNNGALEVFFLLGEDLSFREDYFGWFGVRVGFGFPFLSRLNMRFSG